MQKCYTQNISKIQECVKRIIHHEQIEFIPGIQSCFNIRKSTDIIHHSNRLRRNKFNKVSVDE